MKRIILLVAVFFLFCTTAAGAADIREITWENLQPAVQAEEDPLRDLTEEEKGFVEWIIYLRRLLPKEITSDIQEYYDELNNALPSLKKRGIDVDKIIAERKYRNSAVNTDLQGQVVKLAGYLLPLDLSGKAVTDFLLVPYVGACIHTPPPPPNQIVHAMSATPVPYEVNNLYKPVWITGELKVMSLTKELFLMDGSSNIDIGYSMSVSKIEDYTP